MRDRNVLAIPFLLGVVATFILVLGRSPFEKPLPQAGAAKNSPESLSAPEMAAKFTQMPLRFEANAGQADSRVKFLARGSGYTLFLTPREAVLSLQKTNQPSGAVVRMRLAGANAAARAEGVERLDGVSNYFLGNDPRQWRTEVPNYAKVRYRGVYPGVDLIYYGRERQLEYDFVVAPGADPRRIEFAVSGARRMRLDASGDLALDAGGGEVTLRRPVIYQQRGKHRREIAGRYALRGANRAGFELAPYEASLPLVIDPTLAYSTYLGGSSTDLGLGIALDSSNNIYVTGSTESSNFPTLNPINVAIRGLQNVFVTKLNANGSAFVYSTYVGGTGTDSGNAIAVDGAGSAYVAGTTNSANFPTAGTPLQAQLKGTQNAFVMKLNLNGSALTYSTYLGGSNTDSGNAIDIDSAGDAYVIGQTNSNDFPVASARQAAIAGAANSFISKLKPDGSGLLFSTYLGGSGTDSGNAIALDSSGNAYLTGQTSSPNFPTANPLQAALGGSSNAFVAEIKSDGSALVYSTYLGGTGADQGNGIALDGTGNACVTGATTSANFPTKLPLQPTLHGDQNAFVAKVAPNGASLIFSTYLGGSSGDRGLAIALDSTGNIYLTGQARSSDFPLLHPFAPALAGSADAFVTSIKGDGSALVYSTFFGGNGLEFGTALTTNSTGQLLVLGVTQSSDFPLQSPKQSFFGGSSDAFIARVTTAAAPGVLLTPVALAFPTTDINKTSDPLTATVTNTGDAALAISGISVIGPNSTEFTQTNTCGSSVAAGASCAFTVKFLPTAGGSRSASIRIADNAVATPHLITLSGNGNAPAPTVALFPGLLTFSGVAVGESASQPVTLTNNGTAALTITSMIFIGTNKSDFTQTNTCGTSVAVAATCTINVTFKPAATGARSATLNVNDNAPDTPQFVFLLGGEVFGIFASPSSASLTAGESVSTTVTVSPGNGFNQAVALTCTNLPQGTNCIFVPSSVTPNGKDPITAAMTITTTVRPALVPPHSKWWPGASRPLAPWPASWLALLAVLGAAWSRRRGARPRLRLSLAGAVIVFLCIVGCGGSGTSGPKAGPTPAGTFNITINGTAGKLVETSTFQLIVN